MNLTPNDLEIAIVTDEEDEDYYHLKIVKDKTMQIPVEEGMKFHTLVFLRKNEETNEAEIWRPWENQEEEKPKLEVVRNPIIVPQPHADKIEFDEKKGGELHGGDSRGEGHARREDHDERRRNGRDTRD